MAVFERPERSAHPEGSPYPKPSIRPLGRAIPTPLEVGTCRAGLFPTSSGYGISEKALETAVGFKDPVKAAAFEKYLKTGLGFAFAKKHF